MSPAAAPSDGDVDPRVVLLVLLLLLAPAPHVVGQGVHQYACEQVQQTPASGLGSSGLGAADECTGSGENDGEQGASDIELESSTASGTEDVLTAPPGAHGYPLLALDGADADGEPVEIRVSEPSLHSILVEGLVPFEELALQFAPAKTPDIGRAAPCLEGTPAEQVLEDSPLAREEGYGTWVEARDDEDGANASIGVFPENGYCAALEATAEASVVQPLFDTEYELASCTALACEFQTRDRVSREDSSEDRGSALFGPLVLYPGRWQVVRTNPGDIAWHAGQGSGGELAACDNPAVVLCFDVEACVDTRDVAREAPDEQACAEPIAGGPLSSGVQPSGSSGGDGCETRRDTHRDGVSYRWNRCHFACPSHESGELEPGNRRYEWPRNGGTFFEATETWDAESRRDHPQPGDRCDRHRWREADVLEVGLGVAGPRSLADRYSDTWNITLHASVRECQREEFPISRGSPDRCHDAFVKKPVLLAPDYKQTREADECSPFHPPYPEQADCVRVALDAHVLEPETRETGGYVYHTGGDGPLMPASNDDSRVSGPDIACLAVSALSLLARIDISPLVRIGCLAYGVAGLRESGGSEGGTYSEYQGEFLPESGYDCDGGCWYLDNHMASSDTERDQMAFGAMIEMGSCGKGWASEYVAGTFLKGLVYQGPTGGLHQEGGDPANRSAGHHYWGPGLTVRSEIPVYVREEAPSCVEEETGW